jgi:DNA-binding Xre family transcriptional regulator
MSFSYNPLWKILIDRGMTKTQLRLLLGISTATLAKLSKDEYVSMTVLNQICSLLDCRIEVIIEHIPNET